MGFLRPVGPLPAGAYWLRRLLVVVVVLLVAAVVWWLLAGRGSGSAAGASGPGGSASGTPSTGPSATTTPSQTTTASRTSTPSSSSTAHPSGSATVSTIPQPCPDSAVSVVALTSESSYPAGSSPRLTVQVTNTSASTCTRDLGQVALELLVSSGSTRVWSSDDCNPGGGHAVATLRPHQVFSSTVVWDRTTSKPGCPALQPKAAAGSYQVTARNLAVRSAPAPFSLS